MISRKDTRGQLRTLLTTALVDGDPRLVQSIYDFQNQEFEGESPVVLIYSGGSNRPQATLVGHGTEMHIWVDVFVSLTADGAYTEEDAEDRLDDIEAEVAGVVEANANTANWRNLRYQDVSTVFDVKIGGVPYIRELIPLVVEVLG